MSKDLQQLQQRIRQLEADNQMLRDAKSIEEVGRRIVEMVEMIREARDA